MTPPAKVAQATRSRPQRQPQAAAASPRAAAVPDRQRELEIKVAYLERHIEEQDRSMLDNYRALERLRRDVQRLSESLETALASRAATVSASPADEPPPPHY